MLGELREYITTIEAFVFENDLLKSKDKRVLRVGLHVRAAKDVALNCTNDAVIAKWLLTLAGDYDKLCHHVMYTLKPRERGRQRPVA